MNKFMKIGIIVAIILVVTAVGEAIYFGYNDFMGPLKSIVKMKITNKYDSKTRQGEIIFYGASNFARWTTLDEDLSDYKVQNHAFGGSSDIYLVKYADKILFPYKPKVVFFQTGSNDYVEMTGTDEEKISKCMKYKKEMFESFHKQLPDATFVIMSGLLLPGRSEYTKMTQEINKQLKELCEKSDYMYFVDSSKMTYDGQNYDKTLFVKDGIHLNEKGHDLWTKDYIVPAIEKVIKEKNLSSLRK